MIVPMMRLVECEKIKLLVPVVLNCPPTGTTSRLPYNKVGKRYLVPTGHICTQFVVIVGN